MAVQVVILPLHGGECWQLVRGFSAELSRAESPTLRHCRKLAILGEARTSEIKPAGEHDKAGKEAEVTSPVLFGFRKTPG